MPRFFHPARALVLCVVAVFLYPAWATLAESRGRLAAARPRDRAQFVRQHAEFRELFARSLAELQKTCEDKQLTTAVGAIKAAGEYDESRLEAPPRAVQPDLPASLLPDERFWRTQLRQRRQTYAQDLYLLARRALAAGHVSLAYSLIRETAHFDPDHAPARKILGYVRSGDAWVSPFEASMLKAKKVWHPEFGWIPREHVERYERGERYLDRRWVSAAREAEVRSDFSKAWEIRTEHYLVRTNHSQERGVELARKLEDFHDVFFQTMAGFFNSPQQIAQLFEGAGPQRATVSEPNKVNYYRSRDEYLQKLKSQTDQSIEITNGMYFPPPNGVAYFFYTPDSAAGATLYHEATHQLLSGSRPQIGPVAMKANFWLVEGIACYMESFERRDGAFSLGNPQHVRVQNARRNCLELNYYVPFRKFSSMGMLAFQNAAEIRRNYSQCAALTHFFMNSGEGRYREALIDHLSQIYSVKQAVRENPEPLAELIGVSPDEIDQQYVKFLKDIEPLEPPADAAAP